MENSFSFEVRIYYDSTDAGGVVYHSKYLDICERARTEFLRSKGIIQSKLLKEENIGFVVSKLNIEYKKSAKLDDLLNINTSILENNGLIIKMKQEIYLISREDIKIDNTLLCSVIVDIVAINTNGKLIRIPKNIIELLK